MPMVIFEAQSAVSKRIATVNIQQEGDDTMSTLVSGNMWVHRSRFDAQGIPGTVKPTQ